MIGISAQVSLYPLGQAELAPAIQEVLDALAAKGLPLQTGSMSTLTWGDDQTVFEALREGFHRATQHGPAVMVITISNACPLPEKGEEDEG